MKNIKDLDLKIKCNSQLISFSDTVSKLTKMSLKLLTSGIYFSDTFIITYPSRSFNILPLYSVFYTDTYKKDILVITPNNYKEHIKKYENLQVGKDSIYHHILPFNKSANRNNFFELSIKDKKLAEELLANDENLKVNKIIFSSDLLDLDINILKTKKYIGKKEISLKELNVQFGLVVIENADLLLVSELYYVSFLKLISNLIEHKIKILIHFSNPYSPYITRINKDTKNLVLLYDSNFLITHKKELYNHHWENKVADNLNYEIDNPNNYEINYEIYPSIDSGNLDYYYTEYDRIKKQNWSKINEHRMIIQQMDTRFREMYNLSIHPSGYVFNVFIDSNFIPNNSISDFISEIKQYLEGSKNEIIESMEYLLSLMNSFYLELKESKRYFDKSSYNAICKNLVILDLLRKEDVIENAQNGFVILIKNNYERRKLFEDLKSLNFKYIYLDNIKILTFDQLSLITNNPTLIVPGCLDYLNQLVVLFNMFSKIVFLTYRGLNKNVLETQIKEYETYCSKNIIDAYLNQLFNSLKIDPKIIPSYLKPKECEPNRLPQIVTFESSEPVQEPVLPKKKKDYQIIFKDIKSKEKVSKSYYKDQRLLTFNKNSFYEYKKVKNIRLGDIILDIEGKRSILDILSDLYGLSSRVDLGAINEYYNSLINFVDSEGMSLGLFYDEYLKFAETPKKIAELRLWINQGVIGPENVQDIEALGKSMRNEDIISKSLYIYDEINKIRSNHIQAGKKLKRIIDNFIYKKKTEIESFAEYALINSLLLYEVKEVKKLKY